MSSVGRVKSICKGPEAETCLAGRRSCRGRCEWNAESQGEQQEVRAVSMGPALVGLEVLAQTWGMSPDRTAVCRSCRVWVDGVRLGMHFEAGWTRLAMDHRAGAKHRQKPNICA